MEIRPIEAGDEPALSRFFERIPESDRTFFKEDVGDPRVLDDWVQPGAGRTIAGLGWSNLHAAPHDGNGSLWSMIQLVSFGMVCLKADRPVPKVT